jgi:hypothetical protein
MNNAIPFLRPLTAALMLAFVHDAWADPNSPGSRLVSEAALERAVQRGEVPGRDGQAGVPAASAPSAPSAARVYDDGSYKGYLPAAMEILAFQAVLNRFDNAFEGADYGISMGSIRKNLHSSWVEDQDPFRINQLGHPYQGSIYFGTARSNGIGFWGSMGYAFAGSAVWEVAGETTPPSRNDQITTSFGGTFLGESFYRMAQLVLQEGYGLSPGWREVAAAVIAPPLGVNRRVRPGRGSGLFDSHDPALFSRLQLGSSRTSRNTAGPSQITQRGELAGEYLLEYGMPGKRGYTYDRPFDYFRFEAGASSVNGIELLSTRGLLFGAPYESGRNVQGIAGLYGSYDYVAPQLFRVASTAVSLGSNVQWWLTDTVALQGHGSVGYGYTSTGTIRSNADGQSHYGFAPQAVLSLRLLMGDRLTFDTTAREFFDGKLTSTTNGGKDRVLRADASLTYRVTGNHAVALRYATSRRQFTFPNVIDTSQRRDTVGLYYVYQPAKGFSPVR